MQKSILLLLLLALSACTPSAERSISTYANPNTVVVAYTMPQGITVSEYSPSGYFIRLSSPERPSLTTIAELASNLSEQFDRIDFCLDSAHERGDEYLSVIEGKVYDHENDKIYSFNITSK